MGKEGDIVFVLENLAMAEMEIRSLKKKLCHLEEILKDAFDKNGLVLDWESYVNT